MVDRDTVKITPSNDIKRIGKGIESDTWETDSVQHQNTYQTSPHVSP